MLKLAFPLPAGSLLVFFNQKSRWLKKGAERCHFTLFLPFPINIDMGFSDGSDSKESTFNAGYVGSFLGWEDALQEGMANHSRILAWRIPWTAEPGGLQSMGSQSQTQTQLSHWAHLSTSSQQLTQSINWSIFRFSSQSVKPAVIPHSQNPVLILWGDLLWVSEAPAVAEHVPSGRCGTQPQGGFL